MKFIKKHKKKIIIALIILIIALFTLFFFRYVYYPSDGPVYGNRLNEIEQVIIKDNRITEIESTLLSNQNVEKSEMVIRGKIINIIINVNNISKKDAKKILESTLDKFSEEEKSYYDFQYFIMSKSEKEEDNFTIIGYKNKISKNISWTE